MGGATRLRNRNPPWKKIATLAASTKSQTSGATIDIKQPRGLSNQQKIDYWFSRTVWILNPLSKIKYVHNDGERDILFVFDPREYLLVYKLST